MLGRLRTGKALRFRTRLYALVFAGGVLAVLLAAALLWSSMEPSAQAAGGPATPTNTPGPAPTAKPPAAGGALTGVSDIVVDGGNPTLDAYHCISYTQDRGDGTVKTAAQCFDNAGALADADAEPLNDAVGEGPSGDFGGVGPPPPPPYSPAAPAKGTGTLAGDILDTWTCFPELGGPAAPNVVARLQVTGAVAQLNASGKQTATTNLYLAQSDAVCAQAQSGATPSVTGSPITLGATVYPATDNANCPASNCLQASWRNGGAPSPGGDFDGDGCTDQAELDKLDSSKCGDDPWNPNDTNLASTDVAGDYSLIATVADDDVGSPGFYYPCTAAMEQSGKNVKAWVNCYIDSPGIVINPQAAKDNSNNMSNPTSCGVGPTQAPVDYCGDGSPGSPPPGVTAGTANIHNFADIDDKPAVLTGTIDNTKNIIILSGCFEDRDGHSPLGNVYVRASVDLHTGHGFVEIHAGETTANCTGGTPANPGGDAQLSIVRQRKGLPMRDADSDRCGDRRELGDPGNTTSANTFQGQGGLRDPGNHYDYMNPTFDGLNRVDDILATVNEYFDDDPPGKANIDFKSTTDRTALTGGNAWNLGPPNGQQRVDDILAMVKQYFHDCSTTAYGGGGGPPPDTPTPTHTPTNTPTDTPTPTSTPTGGGEPAVFGELGTSGNEVAILPGTTVTWTCDPGNPTTDTAVRFDYDWGNEDVNDPGTGALSVTQKPPENVLNSVACVFDGNAGTPITVDWPPLVDPSGFVTDIPSGLPIPEAIVTLQVESPPNSGIYVNVPVESDPNPPDPGPYGIKEPDFNPETTGPNGEYGWDVVAGRYRVVVSKATCSTVTSAPVDIPPPVTDLNVGITCQDNNSNNIPDVIESLYGFNDPAGDADGDGLTNQEELTLGLTNPLVRDDVDRDGDGCVNLKKVGPGQYRGELTSSQLSGGLRDDSNPWDYFDPDTTAQPPGFQRIQDIVAVVNQYFQDDSDGNPGLPPYAAGYNPDMDRTYVGTNDWNLGPPNGLQRVDDILDALNQYYNDCA